MKNLTFDQLPQAVCELYGKLENIEQLLLANKTGAQVETADLITIKEAAEFLHLSVPTLYGYVSKSVIPVCKRPNSKRLWFSKQELTEWIKAGRKQTATEIKAEAEKNLTRKQK